MSGIAAIIRFDGKSTAFDDIERTTAAMDYRGLDGRWHWRDERAALGFCAMHTTQEAFLLKQPVQSEDGSELIVFDGFLQNIDELRKTLRERGVRQPLLSDAEIALSAYRVWGEDFPLRCEGEFAFIIWDRSRRTAFCAIDHVGIRTLHYHWDGRQLIMATDVAGIFAGHGVAKELNRQMVAEVAANEWLTSDETIWKDVYRLEPAVSYRFHSDGLRKVTYWSPPTDISIVYKRDEEYAEHYGALLRDAVRLYSRSQSTVACDVSGGLDSSAVFATAVRLSKAGQLLSPGVRGYTYSFSDFPGSDADEMGYVFDIAEHVGEPVIAEKPFLPPLEWFAQRAFDDQNLPPFPNVAMAVGIGRKLTSDGGRVILNGEGGDEWTGGRHYRLHEDLIRREWARFFRNAKDLINESGLSQGALKLARYAVLPIVDERIRQWGQAILRPKGPNHFNGAEWLTSRTEDKLVKARKRAKGLKFHDIPNRPRRLMMNDLKGPFRALVFDQINRQASRLGYEVRMPMHSRRLIEFAFATPEHTRIRGNVLKCTHRAAMENVLPKSVLERTSKADFSIAFGLQLDRLAAFFGAPLAVPQSDYLNREGLRRLYWIYQSSPLMEAPIWELWGSYASFAGLGLECKENLGLQS